MVKAVFSGFLLILLFSFAAPSYAEAAYYLPDALSYSGKENNGFSVREFRPIGWSEKGKFAYLETLSDKRYDNYFVIYHIVDTITDEHVFEFTDTESFKSAPIEKMAEASWDTYGLTFSGHLSRAGIRQRPYTFLPAFPISANGARYTEITESAGAEAGGYYSVFIEKNTLPGGSTARKLIGTGEDRTLTAVQAVRYLPSPYENRIAVIVEVDTSMKEIYYTIMGCHLIVGFE